MLLKVVLIFKVNSFCLVGIIRQTHLDSLKHFLTPLVRKLKLASIDIDVDGIKGHFRRLNAKNYTINNLL